MRPTKTRWLGAFSPVARVSTAMRTFLAWRERVTISPVNSLVPDFLKVPMVAMVVLAGFWFEPAPLRPRWRSVGRRRSTAHPEGPQQRRDYLVSRGTRPWPGGEDSLTALLRLRRSRRSQV